MARVRANNASGGGSTIGITKYIAKNTDPLEVTLTADSHCYLYKNLNNANFDEIYVTKNGTRSQVANSSFSAIGGVGNSYGAYRYDVELSVGDKVEMSPETNAGQGLLILDALS